MRVTDEMINDLKVTANNIRKTRTYVGNNNKRVCSGIRSIKRA